MSTTHRKNGKKHQLVFYNEITKENKAIGSYNTLEECNNERNKIEIEFYSKNKQLLPKGVTTNGNMFCLSIKVHLYSRSEPTLKRIASARFLKEIKELKLKCLTSIIG